MYHVQVTGYSSANIEWHSFDTKDEALKWLDKNWYYRDVVNTGNTIKKPPDTFWNSLLKRRAILFKD